ncbi:hypothetical protein FRB96_004937 [Tulasnella sp. 330]|nr:hypothetical protein FRB96_004937 [Tulasnella sp. 330]KAG8875590.1 hypothetical protein FRB98_007727 [Tulasnella sp. 332]
MPQNSIQYLRAPENLKGERVPTSPGTAERIHYRICILGNSGSGKSTLSKELAQLLGPHTKRICMDSIFWNDDWVETPPEVFEEVISNLTRENDDWIADGNYIKRKAAFWPRATDIICE